MDKQTLKQLAISETDKLRGEILSMGRQIYRTPETGYKEEKTTRILSDALRALGLPTQDGIAVTGCRAHANADKNGPKVAVMGELDSVICREHPDCDPRTGAVHACGHNIQTTVMYGVAAALTHSGVLPYLDGRIDFMAVPAEEYIELGYRKRLREEGKIRYYAGKPELIWRGAFDDVDMCMMVHNFPIAKNGYKLAPQNTGNGFIGKITTFYGKQAHAGAAPWEGVNALNMASLAITGMNMHRETFKDEDHVRIHQIINKGGSIVNCVPSEVEMETTVRARSLEALKDANGKVNRSIMGAAAILGGHVKIVDSPGQMPLKADVRLAEIFKENALAFYRQEEILPVLESTASFDMGDLSLIMPVLHGITSGIEGGLHAADYRIVSEEDAYIIPVKIMLMTLIDLLYGGAAEAMRVKAGFRPPLSKAEYLETLDALEKTVER